MKKINKYSVIGLTLTVLLAGCQETVIENDKEETSISTDQTNNNDSSITDTEHTYNLDPFESTSETVLVNKEHSLNEDYVPEDLVTIEVPYVIDNPEVNQLRANASTQLSNIFEAALENDIELKARSGYRSYSTQVNLYTNYVENHGQEAADRFSARPGTSEHQTGLAMDITSEEVNNQLTEDFINVSSGQWLSENAHQFGFIMRYPEGKEEITGYQYEPWHYRYVGEEIATYIYENEITYEEFVERYD